MCFLPSRPQFILSLDLLILLPLLQVCFHLSQILRLPSDRLSLKFIVFRIYVFFLSLDFMFHLLICLWHVCVHVHTTVLLEKLEDNFQECPKGVLGLQMHALLIGILYRLWG